MFWLKSVIFRLVKISGLFWLNSVVFNIISYGNKHRKYCSHACYINDRFGGAC